MSAKEMFKELGFPNCSVDYTKDKITCITYRDDNGSWIKINPNHLEYVCNHEWVIQTKHLPAIVKQCEELGWIKNSGTN